MVISRIEWYKPHWKDKLYWIRVLIIGMLSRLVLLVLGIKKAFNIWKFIFSYDTIWFGIAAVIADYIMFYVAKRIKR